jgi:hypothetical protein
VTALGSLAFVGGVLAFLHALIAFPLIIFGPRLFVSSLGGSLAVLAVIDVLFVLAVIYETRAARRRQRQG